MSLYTAGLDEAMPCEAVNRWQPMCLPQPAKKPGSLLGLPSAQALVLWCTPEWNDRAPLSALTVQLCALVCLSLQIVFQGVKPLLDSLLEAFMEAGMDKTPELLAAHEAALEGLAAMGRSVTDAVAHCLPAQVLPPARRLAAALLDWWRRPEAQAAAALELAQAAAVPTCAYLRCANLGGEGGPAAGQGAGNQRCRWVDVERKAGWGS